MAQATVDAGQDLSLNDLKLDELSLDDDALFADLDNEVRLEGAGDSSLSLGGKDDLNLDFDVEAVAKPKGAGPSKSGNGKGASQGDRLNLDLDDATVGGEDLNLDLGDLPGPEGDLLLEPEGAATGDLDLDLGEGKGEALNLDFDEPASARALGGAAPGGEMLDLDIADATTVDLDLGESPAPAAGAAGDVLDLDISDAMPGGDEVKLDLEEPRTAAPDQELGESLDLDISDATPPVGAAEESLDLDIGEAAADVDLDMEELPAPAGQTAAGKAAEPELETFDLGLEEPVAPEGQTAVPAAEEPELETFELEMADVPAMDGGSAGAGAGSLGGRSNRDVDDRSRSKGAEQLDKVELGEERPMAAARAAAEEPLLDMEALPAADASGQGAPEAFQAAPDVDLDSVDLSLDQAASEFKAVPDVDLDAVDLSLDMPFAETRGDEGAAISPPGAMGPPPSAGGRAFAGLGTGAGGSLEVPKDELLELNLADLESGAGASAGGRTPAPDFRRSPGMAAAGVPAGLPATGASVGSVLLSIPHQVQVRMGSVSLLGEEILNLSHGSVVPLNRAVGEPVDLTLDGKTIAQGEIVVINGRNLGVRIVAVSK